MNEALYSVLFVCTGISARSIMAEAVLDRLGHGKFEAFSAGSHPVGIVNPIAIETLTSMKLPVEGLRSRSWDEFAAPGAPALHFIFTVCDTAPGEICPARPGQPVTAHWGAEDPAAVFGSIEQRRLAFKTAFVILGRRMELLPCLPIEKLDNLALQARLTSIGKS